MSTITIDEAEDILCDRERCVATQDVSKHRWYTRQLIVYRDGSDLRGFYYMEPATEIQEGQDCFDSDPVDTFPVAAREVVSLVYEAA